MEYQFIIRKAVTSDAGAIRDILSKSIAQYIEQSRIPLPLEAMLEDIETIEREIDEVDVFIAFMDGVPVGTVRVDTRGPRTAQLRKLGVVSGQQNIGIGKSLMNLVDKVIRERGIDAIELYTAAKNAMIMRFYYARGFYVDSTSKERGYIRALMRKEYYVNHDNDSALE